MKILHVITGMARAAGTSVFCGEALRALAERGHDCRLWVRHAAPDDYPTPAPILAAPPTDWLPDVVHIHALWTPWLFRAFLWARRRHIPIVWSPHGMLTPWALSQRALKKRLALALYQWWGLRGATLLHATALSEVEDCRRVGLRGATTIIPLGVDLPTVEPPPHVARPKVALFVSRVHPKKGLFNLIDAWSRLRPEGWRLLIAGPSDGTHAADVIARARAAGLDETSVAYLGPVYGEEKDALYANAKLFLLPTHSENFGSVVIEALAAATPVITTVGTPWEELRTHNCGWWIEIGVEPLVEALRAALALTDAERQAMGERGRALVRERYTWPAVGHALETAYQSILPKDTGGTP